MKSLLLPTILLVLTLFLSTRQSAISQNLAPNPGFETYSVCPETYGNGGPLECEPWQNGNLATSDFFHTCAVGTDAWVPDNIQGSQMPHTGNGYTGFFTRESSIWREYVQAQLLSPCVAGITYHVSFYVSLADNFCATANIGAHFSATPPGPANNIGTLNAVPQIEANLGYINDNQNWVLITGCFIAQGGEQWITIGNFYNNANTPMEPGCNTSYASYYYLDDVTVEAGDPGEELELDLEEDFTTCAANYTIDPGVTGVDYHWSTGETTPTITVDETDVYILTITSGCASAIDSVEITFETTARVQLGPPVLFLCEGETFNVSLDPSLGEYTWQDGSHNPVYTISTPGLYQVTLENACGSSSDEIEIIYGEIPAAISLGEDVALCPGETISFSFDPELGDFLWQDGSTSNEYVITSPGIYSLTVSNDCGSISDQMVVTISSAPVVDLGPATMDFCEGEEIIISYNFDPDAGDYLWQDGSTNAAYVINSPGTFSVTVTNQCVSTEDEIIVTTSEQPAPFTLGDDTYLCSGEVISYSFDPSLGIFEWQDQSAEVNYVIETGGVYHLTISNECGAVSDTLIVTEFAQPFVDLGPDKNLCEGDVAEIVLDPSLGIFLWQDGSTNSTYTISQGGTYSVSVSNGCGTDEDEIIVTNIFSLEVNLGEDIKICPSQLPFSLDASHPNATSYSWQDNSTMPVYITNSAGVYAVTVSNSCFQQTDQITVTIEDISPQVALPDDVTLCHGDTLTLTSGNAFGDYIWQNGSTNASFLVYAPGTYSLQVTNACGTGFDTIHVDYTPALLPLDLGADLVLCPGTQTVLDINVSGVEFTWQDGSHVDSMIISAPGMYWLDISNTCEFLSDTFVVNIDDNPPSLQLQDTISLCAGSSMHLDAGIAGVTYLWSGGSTDSSIDVIIPGTYSLTVSNACGTAVDSVVVISSGTIPADILPDSLQLCEGELEVLTPNDQTALSYQWHDGLTTSSHMVSNPGWYILQMTYGCGEVKDSTYVEMISKVSAFNLGNDTILCDATSILLSVESNGNDVIWHDGSSGEQFLAISPGVYFVEISNQCNSYTDTIAINEGGSSPDLDLGSDQSLCPGEIILLAPNIEDVSFQWSDGSTDSTYTVTGVGIIYLVVENECGVDSDTIEVSPDVNGPQIELGDTLSFCEGQIAVIQGDVLGVDYLWEDGSTSPELQVSSSGEYSVTVSNACGAGSDTVYVDFLQKPAAFDLGPDTMICPDDFILLNAPPTFSQITWQDGSHEVNMIADQEQTYWLEAKNQCGVARDEIAITIDHNIPSTDLASQILWCPEETVTLDVSQDFNATYLWNTESTQPFIDVNQPGTFSVIINSLCSSLEVEVEVIEDESCSSQFSLFVPNIFSPNGDGRNDFFKVSYSDISNITSLHSRIFDRWGNEVFNSDQIEFSWDGSFHGNVLLPGVYTYLIVATFEEQGKTKIKKFVGDITILL